MGDSVTVQSDVVRRDIGGGNWVEFKAELGYGETKMLEGAKTRLHVLIGDTATDWQRHQVLRMQLWLADWSLTDKGKALKIERATIENLSARVGEAIDKALDTYLAELETAEDPTETTPTESS